MTDKYYSMSPLLQMNTFLEGTALLYQVCKKQIQIQIQIQMQMQPLGRKILQDTACRLLNFQMQ